MFAFTDPDLAKAVTTVVETGTGLDSSGVLAILNLPDDEIPTALEAAHQVRMRLGRRHPGRPGEILQGQRLPLVRERQQTIDIEALVKRREAIAAEVVAGEEAGDGVAFADARQLDLIARMKEVRRIVDSPTADEEVVKARDRVRLIGGVLAWQLAQDSVGRLWDAKVELERIEGQLAEAKAHAAALSAAQRDEPLRFDQFAKRIAAMTPVLQVMIPRVAALGREQREEAQDIAVAELAGQQQRIAAYTTQARFALAQLYDRAYGKQDADRVSAKP